MPIVMVLFAACSGTDCDREVVFRRGGVLRIAIRVATTTVVLQALVRVFDTVA